MADQGKWFKLWVNALTDPTLEELDTDQWFRWVRLGVFIKAHGEAGELTFSNPGRALQNLLRIDNFMDMIGCIKKLPGYVIEEKVTEPSQTPLLNSITEPSQFKIKCKNWNKYQGDFSIKRVRKWRLKHAVTRNGESNDLRGEEKRRDKEEKKKRVFTTPSFQEVEAYGKTICFDLNGKDFLDYYAARGWQYKTGQPMKDWQAAVRLWKKNQREGGAAKPLDVVI